MNIEDLTPQELSKRMDEIVGHVDLALLGVPDADKISTLLAVTTHFAGNLLVKFAQHLNPQQIDAIRNRMVIDGTAVFQAHLNAHCKYPKKSVSG